MIAISPDGSTVIYAGLDQLHRRDLDELGAQPIAGTEFAQTPFFSPDARWVGFEVAGELRKVPLHEGLPVTLLRDVSMRGASWGVDGTIVYGVADAGLSRVSADGGEPEVVTTLIDGERGGHWDPRVLPGNRAALFTLWSGSAKTARIGVVSLDTGDWRPLVAGAGPFYSPTGHILFTREGMLWAVPFDADRLDLTGVPRPVPENVAVGTTIGVAHVALANDGTLLYLPTGSVRAAMAGPGEAHLVWVDREGRSDRLPAEPRAYTYPRISPDASLVALDIRDQDGELWIWDMARETLTPLTFDPANDFYPVWTPDGRHVAFGSARSGGRQQVYWKAVDGTGAVERLGESPAAQAPYAFSPDGSRLVLRQGQSGLPDVLAGNNDLAMLTVDEANRGPELLIQTEFSEQNAEISPDGRWLAYQSNESGEYQIYVRPFPEVDGWRERVSTRGGTRPLWARGSERRDDGGCRSTGRDDHCQQPRGPVRGATIRGPRRDCARPQLRHPPQRPTLSDDRANRSLPGGRCSRSSDRSRRGVELAPAIGAHGSRQLDEPAAPHHPLPYQVRTFAPAAENGSCANGVETARSRPGKQGWVPFVPKRDKWSVKRSACQQPNAPCVHQRQRVSVTNTKTPNSITVWLRISQSSR